MTHQPTRTAPDGESSEAVGRDSGQITRSLILRTALGIIDHDGVDALSMRRLSDAVDRDTTVLYRHVPSKAAVLDGVAEIVLSQVSVDTADGAQVLYLAVYEGRQRFPMSASVGDRYPASVTAVGTALLSELTPTQIAELYWDTSNLVGFTKKSTSTLAELQEKLERTRERGYAVDEGEVHPTVLGLAIPIPGGSGEPSFAIGVSIVHPTGSADERDTILDALRRAADSLTRPRLLTA
jgi:AcrR family transcriptional regulator